MIKIIELSNNRDSLKFRKKDRENTIINYKKYDTIN